MLRAHLSRVLRDVTGNKLASIAARVLMKVLDAARMAPEQFWLKLYLVSRDFC